MSIKLSFWVRPSEKTSENRTPVYLRIQLNNIRTEYSVGVSVLSSEWDKDKEKIKGRSENAEAVNGKLSSIRARALKIYNELLASKVPPKLVILETLSKIRNLEDIVEPKIKTLALAV